MRTSLRENFSSLSIRNFRLYFIAQGISMSGTFMQSVAQAWLVLTLTDSGTALGVAMALQFLPILLFSPYGGMVADRFDKRKILYVTQGLQGVLSLLLGVLVFAGFANVWAVYAIAFLLGCVSMVDNPTRHAFMFEMVSGTAIHNAVTLNTMLMNLCRIAGPALAGVIIAAWGTAPCFVLNGLSFGALIAVLAMMRGEDLHRPPPVPREKGLLRQGFRYVLHTPQLRDTVFMLMIVGTFSFEFQVSLALLADGAFHAGSAGYAFLTTVIGVGAVAGGILIASQRSVSSAMLAPIASLLGISMIAASLMPTFALTAILMLLVGGFSLHFTAVSNSILQLQSAPQMRGRVMSLWTVAYLGTTAIGGPIVGWAAEAWGPRWGLAIGGIGALAAAFGLLTLKRVRFVLRPAQEAVADEAAMRAEADVRIP